MVPLAVNRHASELHHASFTTRTFHHLSSNSRSVSGQDGSIASLSRPPGLIASLASLLGPKLPASVKLPPIDLARIDTLHLDQAILRGP